MSISQINSIGEFKIDFSQEMYLPPNLREF